MADKQPTFIQAARRQQILAAAIDAIVELGYARASLAEIARRAGITKTAIPYYFNTKDALVRQIIIDVFMGGGAYIQPQVEAAVGPTAKLGTFIRANLAYIKDHPKPMAAAFDIVMNAGTATLGPIMTPAAIDPRIIGLGQILRAGQKNGEFRLFDIHIMAVTITQAIDGIHGQLKASPTLDVAYYADELSSLFLHATQAHSRSR